MAGRESLKHRALKVLALRWVREQRYRLAAPEVFVPQFRARIDVAACKPEAPRREKGKVHLRAGTTMILECKQARGDFLRDAKNEETLVERLKVLHHRRELYEASMRRNFPTLREGETLFPEYDVYRFREVGYVPYEEVLSEIDQLSSQLLARTKFSRFTRWRGANLHYVVAEPGVMAPEEVPPGWGLLVRTGEETLELARKADWMEAPEINRWTLMMRISLAASAIAASACGLRPEPPRTGNPSQA
jgi:hypothetical protein